MAVNSFTENAMMKKLLTMSALAGVLSVAVVADANAWTRSRSVSGWRGTASVNASGSCANGTCSRQITRTGPHGNSVSRQGTVTCSGGVCTGSRTTTGPNGNSVTREVTAARWGSAGAPRYYGPGVAAAGFAVGSAVGAAAVAPAYAAPAVVYPPAPVVYAARPVVYGPRPYYYVPWYHARWAYYHAPRAYYWR
ncbi:hypothetical protein EDE08_101795 [Bradyrhizobium sp. R2.2-H]|jgi:hypothetical protein|uniref:hypothetical protein n=1 Tax=unclassified Bradyrhizobium TaxID=2631580 RepID=UPI0010D39D2B|nr:MULTISPECIES: hypothetical protein [unclassified Bradyrhizobium]TCU79012.1 hypothetical protein EDE10_101796 [Bradyrhizobium sp. Y-H1]TCU81095.1 hypothetical protein EDE08_101795 [Bradyrhizobium sp. R2.2-H]